MRDGRRVLAPGLVVLAALLLGAECSSPPPPNQIVFDTPAAGSLQCEQRVPVALHFTRPINPAVTQISALLVEGIDSSPVQTDVSAEFALAADGASASLDLSSEGRAFLSFNLDENADGRAETFATVTFQSCLILEIAIDDPASDTVTTAPEVSVSGTVGPGVVAVTVDGVAASLTGTTYLALVPLEPGANMVVAVADDGLGHTGSATVQVVRDTFAPLVAIDSPPDGFRAAADHVTVTGVVNDPVQGLTGPSVVVNGVAASVERGAFIAVDVPLVFGSNTIRAVASDSVGNQGSAQIQAIFEPPAGAHFEPVSGDGQAGPIGAELPEPLVVRVVDDTGAPLAGRPVRFEVVRNNGSLRSAGGAPARQVRVVTDGAGEASAMLTPGDRAGGGTNRVRATADGVAGELIFCASGLPGTPAKILSSMGDNQTGLVGRPLAQPFEARLLDANNNPVVGAPVTFSVEEGTGNFDGARSTVALTDAEGLARAVLTLGPTAGANSHVVSATHPATTDFPATFQASSVVPGPIDQTRFAGVVLDNAGTPIPGATVTIADTPLSTLTDAEGQFLLTGVPVGTIHLHVDPSTSPRPETFPPLAFQTVAVAGVVNRLPVGPISIPPLLGAGAVVGGPSDVTIQMPGVAGVELTVFANSATFPGGATTGVVTIDQVHLDKVPMPPPDGEFFSPTWTVQPIGTSFDPPARIRVPNTAGLPPGTITEMFSFDHELFRFVSIGTGSVDESGESIVSDPGFGISHAGWGGARVCPPRSCGHECGVCQVCQGNRCQLDPGADPDCCEAAQEYCDFANMLSSSNPRKLFGDSLCCVAKDICLSASNGPQSRNFDDNNWMICINQNLNSRWGSHSSACWTAAEAYCDLVQIKEPFNRPRQQLECFAAQIICHDGFDMSASLNSCGCGTDDDWRKVGDIIEFCFPNLTGTGVDDLGASFANLGVRALSKARSVTGCPPVPPAGGGGSP